MDVAVVVVKRSW